MSDLALPIELVANLHDQQQQDYTYLGSIDPGYFRSSAVNRFVEILS